MLHLRDKRILITGAAGAIGQATAQLFAALGAKLFLVDSDSAALERVAVAVEGVTNPNRHSVHRCVCNVAIAEDVGNVLRQFTEVLGSADCLVLAAGIYRSAPLVEMQDDEWRTMCDVNLTGVFHFCRAFARSLADDSSIVFLSSIAGHRGSHSFSHYAATKSALIGLARSYAVELAPQTRVNVVSPGPIDSPMVAPLIALRGTEIVAQTPLKRLGRPDEVAKAIAFLASDWASFVNGENLHLNGGLYMA